jgi:hypothetical protein
MHVGNLSGNIEAAECVGSSGGARWTCHRAYRESMTQAVYAASINIDRQSFFSVARCGPQVSGFLLVRSIEPFVSHAQLYEDSVEDFGNSLMKVFSGASNETLKEYTRNQLYKQTERDESGRVQGTESALDLVSDGQFQLIALSLLEALAGAAGTAALIMMYVIFILLGRQARGDRKGRKVTYAVEHQLKVYVSWKCIISALTGTLIGITLYMLHCDLAALFGFLVFGLNFIPTVGLLAAVLLPLPLIILAPHCPSECWNEEGATDGKWPYDETEVSVRNTAPASQVVVRQCHPH